VPILAAQRSILGAALAASAVIVVAATAIPYLVKQTIDLSLIERSAPFALFAWWLIGIAAVRTLASGVLRYSIQKASQGLEFDLRTSIYEHLAGLSFAFYDRMQTGQLISRANADIRAVQMLLAFAPMMVTTLLLFVGALAVMISIHPLLTLVALVPVPGVYWMGLRMRGQLFPISWLISARQADVATTVEENVTGVRIVKAFAAEAAQVSQLARASERLRWVTLKQVRIRAVFAPVMENLPRIGRALVLLYGGWLAIEGSVTVGGLVAFNLYMGGLQAPFRMIGFLMIMSQRAAASAARIYAIFDERAQVADKPDARPLDICNGRVEFRDVTFGYADGAAVLDGLSFIVEPGETVAIVGRTGSGKSTLIRLLARLYDVRAGSICIDGVDVRDVTLESLRTGMGLALDEPFLFSETIHDNIAYARPGAGAAEVVEAARAADADRFICELEHGYDTVIGERGYTLSGGQRQRIAIARTLLSDPKLLILDDATSSLDVEVEQRVHGELSAIFQGRTTIVIAHRLSTIALAERVLLLEGGRIVADGTHEQLLRDVPAYAEVLTRRSERVPPPPGAESQASAKTAPPATAPEGIDPLALPEFGS
jgi:ATP-binding cassette subfamily B protein